MLGSVLTGCSVPAKRSSPVPPVYRAMVLELERRRIAIGISMERMSELMGTAERSYAKMLNPETPSGRLAQWETLQKAVDVLYADGCIVRIQPVRASGKHEAEGVRTTEGTRRLIKAEASRYDNRMRRELMASIAPMGGRARAEKMTPAERSLCASNAANARWAKVRQAQHGMVAA